MLMKASHKTLFYTYQIVVIYSILSRRRWCDIRYRAQILLSLCSIEIKRNLAYKLNRILSSAHP